MDSEHLRNLKSRYQELGISTEPPKSRARRRFSYKAEPKATAQQLAFNFTQPQQEELEHFDIIEPSEEEYNIFIQEY